MTTRYQESQIEDVARILSVHWTAALVGDEDDRRQWLEWLSRSFADLFAADNPPQCDACGSPAGTPTQCPYNKEHLFAGGFNRDAFLAACGLKSEG